MRLTEGVRARKARARSRRPSPQQNRGRRRRWTGAAVAPSASIRDGDCGWRPAPFPARRAPVRDRRGGREQRRAEQRRLSQAFLQAFPNLGCFRPSFSKQIFGRFVGFQGVASLKNLKEVSPIFFVAPASLQPYSRRRHAVFRRFARAACVRARSALRLGLRCSLVEGAFMAEQRSGSREFLTSQIFRFLESHHPRRKARSTDSPRRP